MCNNVFYNVNIYYYSVYNQGLISAVKDSM